VQRGLNIRGIVIASIISAIMLTASSASLSESGNGNSCSVTGKPANLDFILPDINGRDIHLREHLGDVILLDFWATWCGPCRIEIPGFIELYDKYRSRGFSVLGISVDDPVEALRAYAGELGMNYPVLIGDDRDDVKEAFGPMLGFPTTFIIDRDGKICHQHSGFATKDQFEQEITSLL
jgi:cytochrome c biogenesis protein CcmG/thiol:disulfide interchange protein DsbE